MKWIIISATLLIILAQKSFSADDTIYTSALAMLNERGRLPCDVSSGIPGDRVVLILWYRGTGGTPIYSFDARGNDVDQGTHWTDRSLLQKRAFFQINQDNSWGTNSKFSAHLEIQPVRDQDQAMYRCRVDYLLSPTKNTITNFTVILPPNKPEIYNTTGQPVQNKKDVSIIGPYNEGSQLILVCKVTGGRPRPVLFWVVKDEVWRTEVEEIGSSEGLRTTLVIPSLTRNYLHAVFQCQATNFNASAPVTSSVTIDMNFLPLSVNILRIIDPMSSSSDYELVCKTWGSRPPATITWWMDDTQQLKHAVMTTSPNNNVTTSILRYHANVEDNGKHLSCRAENKKIPQSAMDSKLKLNIYFHPLVTLQMGSSLDPESIKEGDDVYFECHINANPPVYRVFWYHNGSPVEHKISHGIIMQNQTLVLQKISRTFAGFYSCRGINSEGEGESQPVNLRVMYKPYCRRQTKNIYGTALHEPASVTCEVEADPSVVTFRWTFNNTSEHLPIPATAVASQGLISVASYAPKSHLDYGTLLCWAFNAIGEQKVPCAFAIIPAGPPDQPKNCSIANQTTDTIEVECSPGFDGGLTQSFYMEVYDSTTGALYTNLSSPEPFFLLTSLRPGIAFLMTTYAANAKGRSSPARIETFTLKVAEKRTVYSITTPGPPAIIEFTPLLGFLLGLVGVLFLVVSVVMLIMKLKGKLQPQETNQGSSSTEGLTGDSQDKPLHSRAPRDMGVDLSSTSELEEKDPDLIPHKNDNMLSYSNYDSAGPSTPDYSNQLRSNLHSHNSHRSQTLQALRSLKQRQENIEAKIYKNYMKYMKLHAASMDDSEVTYFELPYPQEDPESYSDVNKASEPHLLYTPFDHSNNSPSGNGKSSNNLSTGTASTTTNSHPHQDALSSSFLPLLLRRNSSIEGSSSGFKICHTSIPNLYATLDYGRGITTSTTSSVINHSTIYATLPHRHKNNMFVSTHSISSAASTSLGSSSSSHPFRDIRLNLRSTLTKHPSESAV